MSKTTSSLFKRFFIVWFSAFCIFPVFAQDEMPLETQDTYGQSEDEVIAPAGQPDPSQESNVQNAVLEGVQLSSEKGEGADEKIVTCYFIFKEQPSSYFYDTKQKEKKLVFEFNDTQMGVSPIPSQQELPIQGFRIEQSKVNVNAEVAGLTPEWHDVLRVSFFLDQIPQINVKDEYSIISFTFKWSTTDPAKYAVKPSNRNRTLLLAVGGVGLLAGGGIAAWKLLTPPPKPEGPDTGLITTDLPSHPTDPKPFHW
jgi:hypothetical protein